MDSSSNGGVWLAGPGEAVGREDRLSRRKWYSDGLRFTCTQCGNCCSGAPGYVWATKEEIGRISEFLGRDDGWLEKRHIRRVGLRYSLTERRDGDCIFLARDNGTIKCLVYSVRPLQCRTWPFWSQNLRSEAAWNEAKRGCPGVSSGTHRSFEEIESVRTRRSSCAVAECGADKGESELRPADRV